MNKTTLSVAQIVSPWISVPPKDYGGTERVVYDLTEELVKRGYEVSLFATGDSHTRAKLHYIWRKALVRVGIPWSDERKARDHIIRSFHNAIKPINKDKGNPQYKYDILHFHLSSPADLIIYELAAQSPIPVICTLHSRFPFDRRPKHIGERDAYYLQWASSLPLIAISDRAKEDALESVKTDLNFIGIIPHGLPKEEFYEKSDSIPTRDTLVWIGRITPDKGTHLALEVAIKLKQKITIGGIVQEVKDAQDYFKDKVEPLINKYPDLISFIGKVDPIKRVALLQRGIAFLNPIMWEEPFGLVMIEAMAQGCPVISYQMGAANELIQPGINGDFATNVDEMALKVTEVVPTIDRSELVEWTKTHFSVEAMTDKYLDTYQIVTTHFNRQNILSKRQKVYSKIKNLQKKYLKGK